MDASMYHDYQPLAEPNRQIRILKIWGSSKPQYQLEASLQVVSLNNDPDQQQPQYWALSWCWGVPGRSKPLILDNTVVQIRENLYLCLLSLIKHIDGALIWIDAICINQRHYEEKNVQVAMMDEIYRNASRVIAWIGEGNAESDLVFMSSESQPTTNDSPRTVQDRLTCFQTVLSRPYWKRLWTVQERYFARQLWILCGELIAPWDKLRQRLAVDRESAGQNSAFSFDREAMNILNHLSNHLQTDGVHESSLLKLMQDNREMQCGETRDRVYALRSLAAGGKNIQVDYSKPLLQVYFDIFLALDFSNFPQAIEHNDWAGYDMADLWRLLKVALQLRNLFPLTESDIASLLSSETFMSCDRRHDISIMQPGEENRLSSFLIGSYSSMIGPRKALTYMGGAFVVPWTIRSGHFDHPEKLVGRRGEGFLFYHCASSIKHTDIRLHLGSERSLLGGVLPIIRRNANGDADFVCLALGEGIFHDAQNRNEMRPITTRALELLWGKNHIRVCMVTPKMKIIKYPLTGSRTCIVGVHFSKLALLTHLAIEQLPVGRNSPTSDLPIYYQEAAERAQMRSSPLSCRCRDSFEEIYG